MIVSSSVKVTEAFVLGSMQKSTAPVQYIATDTPHLDGILSTPPQDLKKFCDTPMLSTGSPMHCEILAYSHKHCVF